MIVRRWASQASIGHSYRRASDRQGPAHGQPASRSVRSGREAVPCRRGLPRVRLIVDRLVVRRLVRSQLFQQRMILGETGADAFGLPALRVQAG